MRISVEPVAPSHYESLVDLLLELHAFYVSPATASRADVRSHLLDNLIPQVGLCLPVAFDENDQVLGFAALVLMHSLVESGPKNCRQCLLKELYVRSGCRSGGVGRLLVQWSANYALNSGCGRMDWNVKASNLQGISFYRSLGGQHVEDRISFRFSGETLAHLARGVA
ncbi:MAG: GNAT family N-acetyltransferase [unclassified Hahellaceae]|nr:GNAT family N-acetyltransferase [Hahellaceae bacterium]|tara:strand:+ start:82483 stop:82986 length:504 start_codon:yes stop_codon:yes gene_type:complete